MKLLIRTKLLEGKYVELKDYELNRQELRVIHCISKDYKTCNHVGEEYMIFTLVQQKKGRFVNKQQSQFPPYSYYGIYKFLWKPKGKIEPEIQEAHNVMSKLAGRPEWKKLGELLHRK